MRSGASWRSRWRRKNSMTRLWDGSSRDYANDPTLDELKSFLEAQSDDEPRELLALAWVGRGDFGAEEWPDALARCRRCAGSTPSTIYSARRCSRTNLEEGSPASDTPARIMRSGAHEFSCGTVLSRTAAAAPPPNRAAAVGTGVRPVASAWALRRAGGTPTTPPCPALGVTRGVISRATRPGSRYRPRRATGWPP
jgi:Protein of unknown function (DUF3775)